MRVAEVMEVAKAELARGGDSVPPDGGLENEPQRRAESHVGANQLLAGVRV